MGQQLDKGHPQPGYGYVCGWTGEQHSYRNLSWARTEVSGLSLNLFKVLGPWVLVETPGESYGGSLGLISRL